jgi:transposase
MQAGKAKSVEGLIEAAVRGELTEAQARQLYKQGPEVVTLTLLAASTRIAELQGHGLKQAPSPFTPSGMVPVYTKPNTPTRRKRPGARRGHPGTRREQPTRIDQQRVHRLQRCPYCNGRLQRCQRARTRIIEDIPEHIQPVVTEHVIYRDYCPKCNRHVEPVVPDGLPHAMLGHRLISLTSWLHYGLGVTIDQIIEILSHHLQTRLTPGGLIHAWQRLAEILSEWHERIGTQARGSSHLHADETGWRVNGRTHWLWCFANKRNCYYMIERCRGSPALQQFFTEAFEGVLITDFWSAYESVEARDRQYCLVHLLRELEKVEQYNASAEWQAFTRRLRRLLRDGMRLKQRSDLPPERYQRRCNRLNRRLAALAEAEYGDADAQRLANRLYRHREHIFTFLDYPDVPYENNFVERQIRPAVILRKNSQSNRSDRGAATQAVLMSVYRTLRLRGHNPTETIVNALRTYLTTGQLPALPS